jgi:maltose/maltodextrin transport system substrate-binding protein
MKSPHFRGITGTPAYLYRESARRCFADLFGQEKVQNWLTAGEPYPFYPKWIYPAKMMGSLAAGMAQYARLVEDEAAKAAILTVARRSANFLISRSEPAGAPWEYCPPTFWDGVNRDIHPVFMGELMTSEPAETGMCYLDLYESSRDTAYLGAALRIARTYMNTQLPNGTWYQRIDTKTGKPLEPALMVPVAVIVFFDRLLARYGREELGAARERAFRWCMEHPMVTFNWEAQFEDTRPRDQYKNQSHREAVMFAALLFRESRFRPEYLPRAIELLRWGEDSFVVWDRTDPVLTSFWFKPNTRWNGNDPYFGSDWFVPCAVEQYAFFTPINGSSAGFMDAFADAFRATGDTVYLAKAVALANTLTIAQRYWGGGEIPTHLRTVMPELNWMNASLQTAMSLLRNADLLSALPAVREQKGVTR